METEAEWDDDERTRMRALGAYEAGICRCGFHTSIATNRDNFFTFEDRRCPVCAKSAQYDRIQSQNDEATVKASGENPPPGQPRPDDGRQTFLRRMTSDEVARVRERKEAGRGNTH